MLFEEDKDGKGGVDLYGPIWIMLTLIVEIAIVGFINYQIDVATLAIELKGGVIPHYQMAYYSLTKIARAAFLRTYGCLCSRHALTDGMRGPRIS